MINSRTIGVLLIAVAIPLTGCEEAPQTVSRHHVDGAWSLAQGAMRDAPLLVVVEGRPFPVLAAEIEESVVEIMTEAVTWTETPRFTSDPAEAISQSLRIVITFNGPEETGTPRQRTSAHEQCSGQSRGGDPLPERRVRIIGTFCDAATVLVTVSGRVGDVDDRHDPQFRALVRQMTLDMLTPQQPPS